MKNVIFEKTVNGETIHMHLNRCTDWQIEIMKKCGWNVSKIIK